MMSKRPTKSPVPKKMNASRMASPYSMSLTGISRFTLLLARRRDRFLKSHMWYRWRGGTLHYRTRQTFRQARCQVRARLRGATRTYPTAGPDGLLAFRMSRATLRDVDSVWQQVENALERLGRA